jgi:uncharacterized membrane protein YtjA (UPF0391 family)
LGRGRILLADKQRMLKSAFGFLVIGVLAAFVGFAGILGGASDIAKFLFLLSWLCSFSC